MYQRAVKVFSLTTWCSFMLATSLVFAEEASTCATDAIQPADAAPAAVTSPHTFSANLTLISQYLYRGLTQSNHRPALQGGLDYSHSSGLYAGAWASSITWIRDSGAYVPNPSANVEIDLYGGIKRSFPAFSDLVYDFGFLRYEYPGSYPAGSTKPTTNEIYGALSWKWLTAKYSYSLGKTFGTPDARGSSYIDLTAGIPLPHDWVLTLHAGRQKFKGTSAIGANNQLSYSDYRVELSKNFSNNWQAGIGATDTNANRFYYYPNINTNIGKPTGYVFIKKTF